MRKGQLFEDYIDLDFISSTLLDQLATDPTRLGPAIVSINDCNQFYLHKPNRGPEYCCNTRKTQHDNRKICPLVLLGEKTPVSLWTRRGLCARSISGRIHRDWPELDGQ